MWSAGDNALSHDVYFGTSSSAVGSVQRFFGDINGDGPVNLSDLVILASQWLTNPGAVHPSADIAFSMLVDMTDFGILAADWQESPNSIFKGNQTGTSFDPGMLAPYTTYYWRIDEVNASLEASPFAGTVWNFTTGGEPSAATNPSPSDGATGVSLNADLSWTAGTGAVSHNLYGGVTNPPPYVTNLSAASFDPGTLASNTTYYWRIDEVNTFGTTTGTVWSFTTETVLPLSITNISSSS